MALRGNLTDFGLADVLQLVGSGARTGLLTIDGSPGTIESHIEEGFIVAVRTGRPMDGHLATRLNKAGVLSAENMGWALAERARTNQALAEVLIQNRMVDEAMVVHQATLQRWETLLEPFLWTDGTYIFEDKTNPSIDQWAEALQVELLIMRGIHLAEAWPKARQLIPAWDWIIARRLPLPLINESNMPFRDPTDLDSTVVDLPEDATEVFHSEGKLGSEPISDVDREIHMLSDPGMRIRDILSLASTDRYETTLTLARLAEEGYLVFSQP